MILANLHETREKPRSTGIEFSTHILWSLIIAKRLQENISIPMMRWRGRRRRRSAGVAPHAYFF